MLEARRAASSAPADGPQGFSLAFKRIVPSGMPRRTAAWAAAARASGLSSRAAPNPAPSAPASVRRVIVLGMTPSSPFCKPHHLAESSPASTSPHPEKWTLLRRLRRLLVIPRRKAHAHEVDVELQPVEGSCVPAWHADLVHPLLEAPESLVQWARRTPLVEVHFDVTQLRVVAIEPHVDEQVHDGGEDLCQRVEDA